MIVSYISGVSKTRINRSLKLWGHPQIVIMCLLKKVLSYKFPTVNFINIIRTNFLYEHSFDSFFYIHVTRKKLPKQHSYEKFVRIMLMKLTPNWFCENNIFLLFTLKIIVRYCYQKSQPSIIQRLLNVFLIKNICLSIKEKH